MARPTLTVDLDELRAAYQYRARINTTPIEDIVWVKDGKSVSVTAAQLVEWRFTGLNNVDFAYFYLFHQPPT